MIYCRASHHDMTHNKLNNIVRGYSLLMSFCWKEKEGNIFMRAWLCSYLDSEPLWLFVQHCDNAIKMCCLIRAININTPMFFFLFYRNWKHEKRLIKDFNTLFKPCLKAKGFTHVIWMESCVGLWGEMFLAYSVIWSEY